MVNSLVNINICITFMTSRCCIWYFNRPKWLSGCLTANYEKFNIIVIPAIRHWLSTLTFAASSRLNVWLSGMERMCVGWNVWKSCLSHPWFKRVLKEILSFCTCTCPTYPPSVTEIPPACYCLCKDWWEMRPWSDPLSACFNILLLCFISCLPGTTAWRFG